MKTERRNFIRRTKGLGLRLPVRAAMYKFLQRRSRYALDEFFLGLGWHMAEVVTYCDCCGPTGVKAQRTPKSQIIELDFLHDIPYV